MKIQEHIPPLNEIEKQLDLDRKHDKVYIKEQEPVLQDSFYEMAGIGDASDEYRDNEDRLI